MGSPGGNHLARLVFVVAIVVGSGCSSTGSEPAADGAPVITEPSASETTATGPGVDATDGQELADEARLAADAFVDRVAARILDPINSIDVAVVDRLAGTDDDRLAWLVADALRFVGRGAEFDAMVRAGSELGGLTLGPRTAWLELNNHLLSTDRPPPPGYQEWKRELLTAVDATWDPFFEDSGAEVDWRLVTFGGVLADRRPFGSDETCQCIAALDDPPARPAADIDWLDDRDTVIGVVVDGQARAYPLHIMETHELVNDGIGDRRIALAYCTLCGAGQAYLVDELPARFQPVVLRTSGLLNRSNKIMFDLTSRSMVDTFTGEARTGPWREAAVVLPQVTTVTSTWAQWREDHPNTSVMTGRYGAGSDYPIDPLGGRDDGGPIFPIGTVDDRLFPQANVIGVVDADGRAVAFPAVDARAALGDGDAVSYRGVTLVLDGSGMRAVDPGGDELVAHQAFWFAWSQFNPDTALWSP